MASQSYAPPQPGGTGTADGDDSPVGLYGSVEDPYGPSGSYGSSYGAHGEMPAYFGPAVAEDEPLSEWNPSEESVLPVRGRHRVTRQRGGTIARSRAVLGVGVIAAVGAGGMATANEDGAGSVAGMDTAADKVRAIPGQIGLGGLVSSPQSRQADGEDTADGGAAGPEAGMVVVAPFATSASSSGQAAGEALRARILQQADQQEAGEEAAEHAEALHAAATEAAEEAAGRAEAARIAEEERRAAEEERRAREAEAERLRLLRASYTLPLTDFRLSSGYGASGTMWQSTHTGTDFAAPTGTPVKNVHTGVVKEAAWAGSYGYRVIIELEDGTEIWYCHLSSMSKVAGEEVITGDTIGTVGSTGNSTGPHLHMEVRPGGSDAVDPLPWLRSHGLAI